MEKNPIVTYNIKQRYDINMYKRKERRRIGKWEKEENEENEKKVRNKNIEIEPYLKSSTTTRCSW